MTLYKAKSVSTLIIIVICLFSSLHSKGQACTGLNPNFSISRTNTCVPAAIVIANTSSGVNAATSSYELLSDTNVLASNIGLGSFSIDLKRGIHSITLKGITTGGCETSVTQTYSVSDTVSLFQDQLGAYLDTVTFQNCISSSASPDSFRIYTTNLDSVKDLHILWGDGSSDVFSGWHSPNTSYSHNYLTTGEFQIKFAFENVNGCIDTTYGRMDNERIPSAGIIGPGSGTNIGCKPVTVAFRNSSTNISVSTVFKWDFGDSSTAETPSNTANTDYVKIYENTVCDGVVTLEASNVCGSSSTSWTPIQVSGKDKASFSVDSSECTTLGKYKFINNTSDSFCLSPDIKRFKWDFGDGNSTGWILGQSDITHSYAGKGTFVVCLYAENGCGTDTFCRSVDIVLPPVAGFTTDTDWGCGNLLSTFTDISTGEKATRLWTINGSSYSDSIVSYSFTNPNTYVVRLRKQNDCGTSITTDTVIVKAKPAAIFSGFSNGCAPHSFSLSNSSTSDFKPRVDYKWDFGNGVTSELENPVNPNYSDSGAYTVRLIIEDTCGIDTTDQVVRIDLLPTIDFTFDNTKCLNDSVSFTNQSKDYTSIVLDYKDGSKDTLFGNTTVKHRFNTSGIYKVEVTAIGVQNCTSLDTLAVDIKRSSSAVFNLSHTAGCAGDSFYITDQSVFSNQYKWYANDVLFSQDRNLSGYFIPTDSTKVTLKLVTIDTSSCEADSTSIDIYTSKSATASLLTSRDTGCGPFLTTFGNNSQLATSYSWDFGDGTTSSLYDPSVSLAPSELGDTIYTTMLIAYNWLLCPDTAFASRMVYPKPNLQFETDTSSGCGVAEVSFTNRSTPRDTGSIAIMNFIWDFDNGLNSLALDTSMSFAASNLKDSIYNVKLQGETEHGCIDSLIKKVTVYPIPLIDFMADSLEICGPKAVQLTNRSSPKDTGSRAIMSFQWSFGNGISSSQEDTSVIFENSATKDTSYQIKLIGTSEHGCIDSIAKAIKVYPKPTVQFSKFFSGSCSPLEVQFTNQSVPQDTSTIDSMSFSWDFGNGVLSSTQDTTLFLTNNGSTDQKFYVQLIGSSEHHCLDTMLDSVIVAPVANSTFSLDINEGCGPLVVTATSVSALADSFYWDFGQGFVLGDRDSTITFSSLATKDTIYNISLRVKTDNNCTLDTFNLPVTLWAKSIASFSTPTDSFCFYDSIAFDNTSVSAQFFEWSMGDGTVLTDSLPSHIYAKNSDPNSMTTYPIRLISKSIKGCTDTATTQVTVKPYPVAQITESGNLTCSPASVSFSLISTNADTVLWDFGMLSSTNLNTTQVFTNITNATDKFPVGVLVKNDFGCIAQDSIIIEVLPQPTASFLYHRVDVCDSGYYDLLNTSKYANNTSWTINNTSTYSDYHVTNTLLGRSPSAEVTHTAKLVVENNLGCFDSIENTTVITPWVKADFDRLTPITACESVSFSLNNT